jgi:Cysteine sulfinate desulfinase/cysteine desulfurase and related enzymes
MIYLDYSATTPVSDEVLDTFVGACKKFLGNPNSLHRLGVEANGIIEEATKQIAKLMKVNANEIIYTSGSSESNNLAILGIAGKYKNRGKHIITTSLEHSSIYGPIDYLVNNGYEVSFVELDNDGRVDLEDLKNIIRDDTILVSINAVNSEIGIIQPIKEIADILKDYHKCYFHVDATQAVGKIDIDVDKADLISFSAHKFYGIKGIGVLIKKDKIELDPIIHGGKSTTKYRSGTPALPLIVSMAKALRLGLDNLDNKYNEIKIKEDFLISKLSDYEKVKINSNSYSIPHILNISVLGVKPETMLHALEEGDIFISTQSACSASNTESKAVYAITNDKDRSNSSIRISLSHLTTTKELEEFLKVFDKCYNKLTNLR